MPHVVIVGAGISGLALAYRLQQVSPNTAITILEKRDRPGGTVWTERRAGFQVECGPNGFLDSKPATLALCRDLGIAEELISASSDSGKNRYLFLDGRLRRLPSGLGSFLASDLLSWRGKLSLLLERFRCNKGEGDESIDAFARRRTSAEVAEVFADGLVTGIHAGDPKLLSVAACFPRLAGFDREHGSIIKGMAHAARQRRIEARKRGETYRQPGKMWSCRDGLGVLIQSLVDRLKQPPVFGVAIRRIAKQDPVWNIEAEGNRTWRADAVVLTCPAYEQTGLLAEVDSELAERVGGIAYNRVAVIALGYRRTDVPMPLDGFGYIAPQRTRRDVLGVQWCSSIFPQRAPDDAVLLRVMSGGWTRPEIVSWGDDRILSSVREELRLAMNISAAPMFHHIVRWDRAIPQYHIGHLDRVAWIDQRLTSHSGLYLGGNAYKGVALNDCTEQAETLALRVAAELP